MSKISINLQCNPALFNTAVVQKLKRHLPYGSQTTDQKRRVSYAKGEIQGLLARINLEVLDYPSANPAFVKKLQNRKGAWTRIRNRCLLTGRHTIIGKFRLSRISFRRLAGLGLLPGVTKQIHR